MEEVNKTVEKLFEDICEDMVNIARVLPNLTPLDLQTELLQLRHDPDRVGTILSKHFQTYDEESENLMSQDIKMIKRVVPRTPIITISKDIGELGQKRNRVQLVLKKYFNPCVVTSQKRHLEDTDSTPSKIIKIEDCTEMKTSDHLLPPNSPPSASNDIKPIEILPTLPTNTTIVNDDAPSTSKIIKIENNVTTNNEIIKLNIEETVSSTIEPSASSTEEATSQDSALFRTTVGKEIEDCISQLLFSSNNKQEDELMETDPAPTTTNTTDDGKTLHQIINNLYPDLSEEEIELILAHLGININELVTDSTLNVVLNEIINYFENKESFEQVQTYNESEDENMFVKTNTQSTESSSTEEYDYKEALTDFSNSNSNTNNSTSVIVKQEPSSVDTYTDKNLGLIREICRGIVDQEDRKEVYVTKTENNYIPPLKFPPRINASISSTTTIIKPVKIDRKLAVSSTVTSASINPYLEPRQIKQERNLMNYVDFGARHQQQHRETKNNWPVAIPLPGPPNPQTVRNSRINIERPTRDNLKSSLRNNLLVGAGHSRTTTTTATVKNNPDTLPGYGTNFVQYCQNRNEAGEAFNEELKFDGLFLGNNQPIPTNTNNNNNNLPEDKSEMSRTNSKLKLTKKEEMKVAKMLCELGNGKCNMCSTCMRKSLALQVRKDLFQNTPSPPVLPSPDPPLLPAEDCVIVVNNKPKQPVIVDLINETSTSSSSSSSNSNPLPGTSTALQPNENHPFFYKIMEMFPDICPDYLRLLCNGKDRSSSTLDKLISDLLEGDYNRRERVTSPVATIEFEEQYKTLLDLFPDADPTYLQLHCERLHEFPNEFKEFVASLLEHKNYPSKEEYLRKMKLSAQQKQYTTEFDVKKFLEVIPNPEEYFKDRPVRRNFNDQEYALIFLKNQYCHLSIKDINIVFRDCEHSVLKSSLVLDKSTKSLKNKRKPYPLTNCLNIPLLQEIAYVKNKNEILNYVKKQELEKKANRVRAKNAGLLKTCECCYDDEVLPDEMACCDNLHVFCKECVKKGCEVKIGEGKLDFPCLTTCDAIFTLQVLQTVLTPKVFSKMAQRKQLEEVKSAGIEELEFCPFCDFATIPAPGDKIFRCLNNDCMKESCRECKEPSHIPLRCDEVEKENDVKLRTYIEDKMTEALVRKCYKCGMKFIKEEGCNKMTCSCGAMMCYVCNQPVKDYKHFNGQGGDQYHLCPLYSDTHKLHMEAVKQSAENAKKELGIGNNQLKIDPTANLDQHYKRLANRNPQNLPPGMEQLNPQHIHIRIQEFHLARR